VNATELRKHRAEVWQRIEKAAGYEPNFYAVQRDAAERVAYVAAIADALKRHPELRDEYAGQLDEETTDALAGALDAIAAAVAGEFRR